MGIMPGASLGVGAAASRDCCMLPGRDMHSSNTAKALAGVPNPIAFRIHGVASCVNTTSMVNVAIDAKRGLLRQ